MKVDIQFILIVVVIVLVVNMIVMPLIKRMMGMVGLEGFSNGGVEWDGNTLVVNGSVEVKGGAKIGGLRTTGVTVSADSTNKNAIMMIPSRNGNEGPYMR